MKKSYLRNIILSGTVIDIGYITSSDGSHHVAVVDLDDGRRARMSFYKDPTKVKIGDRVTMLLGTELVYADGTVEKVLEFPNNTVDVPTGVRMRTN